MSSSHRPLRRPFYRQAQLDIFDLFASPRRVNAQCRRRSSSRSAGTAQGPGTEDPGWPYSITSSSILTHLKSSFQGHSTRLPPSNDAAVSTIFATRIPNDSVRKFIAHLERTHPRVKRATHAIWAWRASASRPLASSRDSKSSHDSVATSRPAVPFVLSGA